MKTKKSIAIGIFLLLGLSIISFYLYTQVNSEDIIVDDRKSLFDRSKEEPTENITDLPIEKESVEPEALPKNEVKVTPKEEVKVEARLDPEQSNLAKVEKESGLKIADRLVNFGFEDSSNRSIDTVIIHTSYDALGNDPFSVSGIINIYKSYGVAAHYLIGRQGETYRLVKDEDIAYHAGASKLPDGRSNVNAFSIGIEMVNTKTDNITEDQYDALNALVSQLKSKYKIKYILGHNQIAPERKDDPWNFEWEKLK